MTMLNSEQLNTAIALMRTYLNAQKGVNEKTDWDIEAEADQQRITVIESTLKPLLRQFLAGKVVLQEFKSQVDGINKRNEYWGFSGIKGQMFFNMLFKTADNLNELDQELKAAIAVPDNEDIAASRIRTFASFAKRLGEQHLEAGGTKHSRPKLSSTPFFLSYFWQIQARDIWPVYYTNSVKVMTDLNLWQPTSDLARDYIDYKHIHEELVGAFSEASGKRFDLYQVEHVFWLKGGNPMGEIKPLRADTLPSPRGQSAPAVDEELPDSYVPPIVSALPSMAIGNDELTQAAKRAGTSIERAFEKSINAAFTILGYDTQLLGQGQGRVPDGIATDMDDSYAIIWDAKVRREGYSVGTDDRTIREYIDTQSRELKRKGKLRNIYYIVISSKFDDDYDDAVRTLKMETHVSEVILLAAETLVALVDAKLRDPTEFSLGPDGVQRIFTVSGIVTPQTVQELLI